MFIRRELGGTGTGCLFQFTYCDNYIKQLVCEDMTECSTNAREENIEIENGRKQHYVVLSVLSSFAIILLMKRERASCFTLIVFLIALPLLVFCSSSSQCHGLVCSV